MKGKDLSYSFWAQARRSNVNLQQAQYCSKTSKEKQSREGFLQDISILKTVYKMAHGENLGVLATAFRVILAAICCLSCLQNSAEAGPVSSRLVAGGIVSNFLFISRFSCYFCNAHWIILQATKSNRPNRIFKPVLNTGVKPWQTSVSRVVTFII